MSTILFLYFVLHICSAQYNYQASDLSAVYNYPYNVYRIPGGGPVCPIASGSTDCKSAIRCSPWFVELLFNPWWCYAQDGSFGTCCPDVYDSAASVAKFPEFSKLKAMPQDISPELMESIITESLKLVAKYSLFEWQTWGEMTEAWKHSAAYSYSVTTHAAQLAQEEGWKGLQSVEVTRKLAKKLYLTPEEAGFTTQNLAVAGTALAYICREAPVCQVPSYYRSYDGSCNNIEYPNWGRSNTAAERVLPPQYADGIWTPKDWIGLPPVDLVSSSIRDVDYPDHQLTIVVMHWGQFVAHDMTHIPTFRSIDGQEIKCCTSDGKYLTPEQTHPLCFPIDVSPEHEFYSQFGVQCNDFVRSVVAPRDDCKFGYADQLNQNTHYLDGSTVYGSTEEVARSLRSYVGGQMKVTILDDTYHVLPHDPTRNDCVGEEGGLCFVSGDYRVNQYTSLTVLHTLWLRLHNKYAAELALINPKWDDERLYQETRRIVGALIQHITYNEYLPSVLGPYIMKEYGLMPQTHGYARTYDPSVKASVTNEFATAAFRYGHSLIQNVEHLWMDDTYSVYGGALHLKDWYNNPSVLRNPNIFNALIRNFMTEYSQNFDYNIADGVHRYLFKSPYHGYGLDLIAANLWRGRDHGLPGYNYYLEACGLGRANDFSELNAVLRPEVVENLHVLYKDVDDIDLFVGILGEWSVKGGIVGPVTSCLIADQFTRTKDGDRFFYENGGLLTSFTPAQLDAIRSTSLARVFCDTADSVSWVTHNVFWAPSPMNPWLPCSGSDIPSLSMNLFSDGY